MTFEGQAAVVRTLAQRAKAADREVLTAVASTLDELAALQRKCLAGAGEQDEGEFSDELSGELIKLLRLPTET
jgi:hypothetical protein